MTNPPIGPTESNLPADPSAARGEGDELAAIKRELLQAQMRLARAKAASISAAADIRLLNARLRALVR